MGATIRDSVMFGLGKWPLREMAITAPNGHLGLELQPNAALNFEQLRNLRNRAFESVIDLCGPWAGLVLATQAQRHTRVRRAEILRRNRHAQVRPHSRIEDLYMKDYGDLRIET